MYVLMLQFLL